MFGASGDLAEAKLLPALFDLAWHSCLAPRFRVLRIRAHPMSDDQFRKEGAEALSQANPPNIRTRLLIFGSPSLLQRPI